MSNFLAIATVTGALRSALASAAAVVPGASITTRRPDGANGALAGAGINIYLYQVTPNAAYRNEDLPTRRADGTLSQRPRTALILHYLLSFFGEERELEPQRLLGAAVRQLHSRPIIDKQEILDAAVASPFLAATNLAEQLDRVRFTPLNLSLDELSKVWSVFFQSPYLLSVAYQAGAVLIESEDTPRTALPVLARSVEVAPFRQPFIERVVAQDAEDQPIFLDSTLLIRGKRFRSDSSLVLLAGAERVPTTVSDSSITLSIPAGTQPGPHGLQVVQKLLLGTPPKTLHRGFESNVGMFVLSPRTTAITKTTLADGVTPALRVTADADIGPNQRVALLLDSTLAAGAASFSLTPGARPVGEVSFLTSLAKIPAGRYFVRLQVDGAASPVDLDPASPTFGPTVTLP